MNSIIKTTLFMAFALFFNQAYAAFPVEKPQPTEQNEEIISPADHSDLDQPIPKSSAKGGGKSQMVALLLCIFLGILGIHRFYLGYYGIGVIQLLTAGGFGIWAIIDLIMIITGDLEPKDGNYDKTF